MNKATLIKPLYFPGFGGAFRSVLSNDSCGIYLFRPLSQYEERYADFLHRLGHNKTPLYLHPYDIKDLSVNLSWYAADHHLLAFCKKLWNLGKEIFCDGVILEPEQVQKLIDISKHIRNKPNFIQYLKEHFPQNTIIQGEQLSVSNLDNIIPNMPLPFIIRSAHGKGGKGNIVCTSKQDISVVNDILSSAFFSGKQEYGEDIFDFDVLVEPYLQNSISLNASCYIDCMRKIKYIDISEQTIEEVFYRGNRSVDWMLKKDLRKIQDLAIQLAKKLSNDFGYFGWLGIDLLMLNNRELLILEVNPRVNSVSHVRRIVGDLPFRLDLITTNSPYETINRFCDHHLKEYGIMLYQMSKDTELLALTTASNISDLSNKITGFINEAHELDFLTTVQKLGHSKSVSYFLDHIT